MKTIDLQRFCELGVATVYEASGRQGLIDIPLIRIIPGSRVAGPVRTVLCGQDDNLMLHAAIEQIQPGEILVVTMPEPGPVALLGDLLATQAQMRGAGAIILDAAVRDIDDLVELGLPVWTRFVRARGATKMKDGEINGTVHLGGVQIFPDDIMVLDADGGVCIKKAAAAGVLQASIERYEREVQLRGRFKNGEISYDIHKLREVVEKNRRK